MNYILSIETATKNCSVALSCNRELIRVVELAEAQFTHAEKLHVFIAELLADHQLQLKDLSAIAISQGPGSYTGLRIGVSTAKGLCYALGIPLIAVDTLEVLSRSIEVPAGEWIVPMIDARRMEVFTAVYNSEYHSVSPTAALVVEADSFADRADGILHILGDGAAKCQELLSAPGVVFHLEHEYPSAKNMVESAWMGWSEKRFVDLAYFEPFYLKDFVMTTKKKA